MRKPLLITTSLAALICLHFLLNESISYAQGDSIRLSSSDLTIEIGRQKGNLLSIQDKYDHELVANQEGHLFEFVLQKEGGETKYVNSNQADRVRVDQSDTHRLTLRYSQIASYGDDLSATLEIEAHPLKSGITFKLDTTNRTAWILSEATYPVIDMPMTLGPTHSDDTAFVPGGDGFIVRSEALDNVFAWRSYPGMASMQFMAYYDDNQGLSLQGRDTEGNVKAIFIHNEDDVLRLRMTYLLTYEPGRDFLGPPEVLYACKKSWMDAAEHYREWALEQDWARPPANQPEWMNDAAFLTVYKFRPVKNVDEPPFEGTDYQPSGTLNDDNTCLFIPYDDAHSGRGITGMSSLCVVSKSWRDFLTPPSADSPPRNMLLCKEWEHEGAFTSPYYFPLYPSEETIKSVLAEVGQYGHMPGPSLAGAKWMIGRNELQDGTYVVTAFDGRERFETEGRGLCVVEENGDVLRRGPRTGWAGEYSFFCLGTEWARSFWNDTCKKLVKAGFVFLHFDQFNGGNCPDCYSTEHGHPRGPGTWKIKRIRELLKEVRDTGQALEPRLLMTMEDPQELLIDRIDIHFSKLSNFIPGGLSPGSEMVPAFQFVYHSVCQNLNHMNWVTTYPNEYDCISTIRSSIWGTWPSFRWSEGEYLDGGSRTFDLPQPQKIDLKQRTLMQNMGYTAFGYARKYLMARESLMLQTEALDVPDFEFLIQNNDYEWGRYLQKTPAIMHSAWKIVKDGEADLAFIFANISDTSVSFAYNFRVGPEGRDRPKPGQALQFYTNGFKGNSVAMPENSLEFTVPAFSVVMIETTNSIEAEPEPAGPALEDFETGDFSNFAWEHEGGAPWFITDTQANSGVYSARAGDIRNSEVSTLKLTRQCQAGEISFSVRTSSESGFDELSFSIDGDQVGSWSGETEWTDVSFSISAGTHSLKWSYDKDGSVSEGEDTAWLDDITLP